MILLFYYHYYKQVWFLIVFGLILLTFKEKCFGERFSSFFFQTTLYLNIINILKTIVLKEAKPTNFITNST